MKKTSSPLSFRISRKVKKELIKKAEADCLNMSQFLTVRIKQKYKYVKKALDFYEAYQIIYDISNMLSNIILDRNNQPYDEFNNDNVLKIFYTITCLAGNADFIPPSSVVKYNGSKTEHISLRLDSGTAKKLHYIAKFYNCKKSSVIPFLLQDNKYIIPDAILPECLCYLTDIRNYFYEKHIDATDFEKEYNLLWKKLL